jgi:hypothetical protein
MPEEPEVDTDEVREIVADEMEKQGGGFQRSIALTTAVLAAFAAVAALKAGATANEALLLKTEATRAQAEASDQWAYYQAKGIKVTVLDAAAAPYAAAGKTPPPALEAEKRRDEQEQADSKHRAEAKERERDARSAEGDQVLHHHHGFADSVALFQVSIALGALASLTRRRPIWFASLALGLTGIVLFGRQLV